jgi:hypothetical protein
MVGVIINYVHNRKLGGSWDTITGYVSEEMRKRYNELYEVNKENKLEANTTVYLTPLANFPSYKLKNYVEENSLNVKTARKLDKLDSLIISHDFITSSYLTPPKEYHIIPAEMILNNSSLKKYLNDPSDWSNIYKRDGKPVTHYFITPERREELIRLDNKFSFIKDYPLIKCVLVLKTWGNKRITDNFDFFLNLFENIEKHNLKIIYDSNISEATNQGLSLDEDVFENILSMISSNDESNLELAKEILANLEYTSSEPYFIYLFNYFYQLHKNPTNNKNYNYLLKQVKKHIHSRPTKYAPSILDKMIPTLMNKHPEYTQDFMNCFRIHMNFLIKRDVIKEIKTH